MSRIGSKNTKPEIKVRKWLWSHGFRYRLHDKKLPGKPDIVMKKYHAIVDIRGCFWHGHESCKIARVPETRREFWEMKIETNKQRDEKNLTLLENSGWNVLVLWECEIKKGSFISKIKSFLCRQ